jgi:hypothetical protein
MNISIIVAQEEFYWHKLFDTMESSALIEEQE